MAVSAGSFPSCPPFISDQVQHRRAITNWMFRVSPHIEAAADLPFTSVTGGGTVPENTLELQTAINTMSQGGVILLPAGGYTISSVSCSSPFVTLMGQGQRSTILYTNNSSVNVITVSEPGGGFCTTDLMMDSTVTRSAGYFIKAASGDTFIDHCYFQHGYHGIYFGSNNSTCVINETQFRDFSNGGYCIEIESNGACFYIRGVIMDHSAAAMPVAGIRVKRVQDLTISECGLIHAGNDLQVDPATADVVASLYGDNTFFDTAGRGMLMTGGGGGSIVRCRFDSCWFSSHTNQGVLIDTSSGTGIIRGVDFVDPQCNLNTGDGINISGPNSTDIFIYGGEAAANGGAGIGLGTQVHNVHIKDFNCIAYGNLAANTYGLFINDSVSSIEVSNCRFVGNGTDVAFPAVPPTLSIFRGNVGIKTKATGSFVLTAGSTVRSISHGLAFAPLAAGGEIMLTMCSSMGTAVNVWLTSYNASVFAVSAGAAVHDITIHWHADLEARNV